MSTSSTTSLSPGLQQLSNAGLLPSNLSASTLNKASSSQVNQLVNSSIASEEVGTLLGFGGDSATLSPTANNALLQEINPTSTSSTSTDPLTAAVDNALTSTINQAVNKFASPDSSTPATGSQINVVG